VAKRCAKCQGASRDDATVCRWCKAALDEARPAAAPPKEERSKAERQEMYASRTAEKAAARGAALEAELQALREWQATPATEPLPRPRWSLAALFGALVVPGLLSGLLMTGQRSNNRWLVSLVFGGCMAALAVCFAVMALLKARHGRRDTPEGAATFFIDCLQTRDWDGLLNSTASHRGAEQSRETVVRPWLEIFGESVLNYGMDKGRIEKVDRIAGDAAVVTLVLISSRVSAATAVTALAGVLVSNVLTLTLPKLLVGRDRRWYFVDGSPDPTKDQELRELMAGYW